MATGRSSSMPSRLRQLLSVEGSIGPSIRLDAEPPPDIKSFIDKVIQSPLSDIAIPLSGFRWEYSKGNFHHWRQLFVHFDKYFKIYLSNRNDLLLSDNILADEDPFPKHTVLQILRAMQIILENSPNKSSFDGLEHFNLLLASTDPEVLIAALETLSVLVKISPSKLHRSRKLIGCGTVNSFLLSIAQGWGSREEGLGLYSCIVANEKNQEEGLSLFPSDLENNQGEPDSRISSTVYFELCGYSAQKIDDGASANSCSRVIHIPDLHMRKEDDLVLMKQCIELHIVPPELRFSLLTRIRYAHAFRSSRICRLYSRICLLSFIVLVQSSDAQEELASFFANEPEYTNELIRIVRSEEPIPGTIRTLAMLALGAQLAVYPASHDRARILSRSSINFAVENRMILLNVLQKAVLSLKISSNPSSIAFVEALLQFYLLHIVSSSSSGSTIRGSGMVPTFLHLLEYADPSHMHLVYLAVKALQKLMDNSSSAVPLLRDLGGVELLSQRLEVEVHHILGLPTENKNDMVAGESLQVNGEQLLSRKRLIKVLLKSLGSATYTPGNANRSQSSQESTLLATLSLIYRNSDKFGGEIYYSAVTVMRDIIHKDPTSFTSLFELGLPEAFLSSVVSGILPSSKALACIPIGLGAICLNSKGLEIVKETSALRFLVDVFTSKKYVLAMNEAIVPFTNAVEELLRHVASLRATGVEIVIDIVDKIASLGETGSSSSSVNLTESIAMEMDSDLKETSGVSHEQFIQLCIFHLIILLHRTMENSETSRLFVEKSGIKALLKLLLRPSIAQSSEGISIALHSTIVFKGFTQHHSSSLARAFCSSLRDQLSKALEGLRDLSGTFLLDRKLSPSSGIFASLFLVEFLLFLAASKDNRWVSALLSEFANGSKDVLENIGHLHREILWHIAYHEGATVEIQNEKTGSSPESASEQTELGITATEGQRFNSFRQFLDPLFRRRTPGWSAESQFFDLINLYRDLGPTSTGSQPRPITDGSSSSSDTSGRREHEKEGSYYTSCCDMVRSLSFHITYIFQELGKAMLLPSRRREDTVNVSLSSKLVASTLASISLDHLNFGGHEIVPEASVSTKCRYLGKVVDFIDAILLDRPDACNPVLINCFYSRGVIQTVLTTFDATSQLLFTINRNRSSPMETDDVKGKQDEKEDTDHAWIYGPLASYGKLMDHLVTPSFILSPFTKHLLVQPVEGGIIPSPQYAETFVKILQSIVLKAVLPIWTHPQFTECSYDYVTILISIIKHVYSGVELKTLGGSGSVRVTGPPLNETTVSTIAKMGFSRSRAEEALRQVGSNSVELATEWLLSHPEEIQEEDELARVLAMSLGNSDSDTKQNVADEIQQEIEAELVSLPPVEELITTCTKLLQMKEPLAFPVRDLLVLICSENNGKIRSGMKSRYRRESIPMCNKPAGDQEQKDNTNSNHHQIVRRFAMDSDSVNSSSVTSPVSSLNDEPHRVKFLCSFLGSILPRPQDGKLRYVGGETRIVSVSRDITYQVLMSKMRELYDGAAVLKYQQPDEDLDALVSVVNDDDVINMMEEYDKLGSGDGFTRLRIFLFSSPEQDGSSHIIDRDDHRESERRYVDALNNLNEGPNVMKLQQHPDSPRYSLLDDFLMVEPMMNQLNIETGGGSQRSNEIPIAQYNNLHQLRIPRVGSGQMVPPRYGEVEGTWSPYYSPRHHGHHDPRTFQDFPSSPSSARYRMPYGEIHDKGFDRMPEDYVRPSQTSHHPFYEHQQQIHDNMVWVPAGTMPPESQGGFPGNVFHDKLLGGIPLNLANPSSEERCFRYGNNLYAPGPESIHSAGQSHMYPQQNIWQNVSNPIAGGPGLPMQVNGMVSQAVIRNPIDITPRHSIGMENQSILVGSPQKISGFDGVSSPSQPYYPNPQLPDRAFPLNPNWVHSENPAVHNEYIQRLEPLSGPLLPTNFSVAPITQTPDSVEVVRPVESKLVQVGEQYKYADTGLPDGVSYLEKPQSLAEEKKATENLVEISLSAAPPEGAELSVERLSFLPELLESVKRAALEGAAEVKAHTEEANDHARPELVENESEHTNAQVEPEVDSDSDNPNNFKIEQTKAEAEAKSRGLQTIRNNDLEEIRELGSGTYGSVYHGKWKGSDVAIKRIKASCFAGKPSERERLIEDFWKEALLLSSLHHPNVVSFYGIVRDGPDGSLATVAEFMVNGSLKQFLQKKDRTIDRRKRLIIAMDTAFGMEYLHGKNIVHFDLKCENLLVNMRDPQRPICKIGDLGLSKVKQKTLVSGGVRGTLPWMAPELLSGKSNMVSEKIDVYSFGIVMWELLTGEEPYTDMHCASIIGGIVNNSLRPKIPQWCDPEWKGLMESCWASEPTERPSFAEISQKLRTMAAAMNLK